MNIEQHKLDLVVFFREGRKSGRVSPGEMGSECGGVHCMRFPND